MKIGDEIKIKGSLGFLYNPTMRIVDLKNNLVLLEPINAKQGGLLSGLNQSWYGIDLIKKKTVDNSNPIL